MATSKGSLKTKLPSRREAFAVFSVIAFIVFSWSLYRMFYQVPSWLFYMNVWNVVTISAYVLAFALFESLVLLGFLGLISLALPRRYFRDHFVAQGSVLMVILGGGAYLLQRKIGLIYKLSTWQLIVYPIIVLVSLLLLNFLFVFIFERFERIPRLISAFTEWMTVFGYIYLPLGLLGLAVVLVRNLF